MSIIVLCGPTCTGKTSLALELSKKFDGEIISADSRQVYKFMDIGTGKIPANAQNLQIDKFDGLWKINNTPIYMYDVVSPMRPYSVYAYAKKARNELESIKRRGKTAFVVGGTGFYIDVLIGRQTVSNVPPNPKLRGELKTKTLEELQETLKKLDPIKLNTIDVKNKVRLIRAIELSFDKASLPSISSPPVSYLYLGLTAPRVFLYNRADLWVEQIIERGLILEVKNLLDKGFRNYPPLKGLVYSTCVDFLDEKITQDELKQIIKFDIHGYIRRQLTWFNRNSELKWFNIQKKGFDIEIIRTVELYINGN